MPIDYVPAPSAYYSQHQKRPRTDQRFECHETEELTIINSTGEEDPASGQPNEPQQLPPLDATIGGTINNITNDSLNLESLDISLPSLSASAEYDLFKNFNPKAIWGPVEARLIPETKRTLSKVIARNIGDLNRDEYQDMRELMVYVLSTPSSKQRVFELTGFEEKDIQFAEKYFRKYKRKFFFTKLVEIALATSSNGKVSRQIGGLIHFIFETDELNGEKFPDKYKHKFIRGIPELITPIWQNFIEQCSLDPEGCERNHKQFMDLNEDSVIDDTDIEIAMNSINWLKERMKGL